MTKEESKSEDFGQYIIHTHIYSKLQQTNTQFIVQVQVFLFEVTVD